MTEPTRKSCDLCGSNAFAPIANVRHGERIAAVACTKCGLVSLRNERGFELLLKHHQDEYWQRRNNHHILRSQTGRAVHIHEIIQDVLHPGLRVLDVGCAFGATLKLLELAGCSVTGVEPARDQVEVGRAQLGLNIFHDAFETVEFEGRTFDLLIPSHVLEHISSPSRFLTKARSLVAETGWMYLEVPNLLSVPLPTVVAGKSFDHEHYFCYSTLDYLLCKTGWKIARFVRAKPQRYLTFLAKPTEPKNPQYSGLVYHDIHRGFKRRRLIGRLLRLQEAAHPLRLARAMAYSTLGPERTLWMYRKLTQLLTGDFTNHPSS